MHHIRNNQLYRYYLGDPDRGVRAPGRRQRRTHRGRTRTSTPDGAGPQLIPGNTFHTARVIGQQRWFLAHAEMASVVRRCEIGDLDELAGESPAVAAELRAIAASVRETAS